MFSPKLDKRHKREEVEVLRRFISTAKDQQALLRREIERLDELSVLDTQSPDALLFLLKDKCFELEEGEYTCVPCC